MTLRNVLISLLFTGALTLSGWSILLSSKSQSVSAKTTPGEPDAFMENVVATMMNKMGKPSLKLETPKMIHYPENDTASLVTPHVTVYRDSLQPWHINAKHAKTKQGIAEITFWDNVIIHHLADSSHPITTMRTDTLTILPNEQVAKTNKAVTLTQPDTVVNAVGMLANWDAGTVKLLSQAREEYVPHS